MVDPFGHPHLAYTSFQNDDRKDEEKEGNREKVDVSEAEGRMGRGGVGEPEAAQEVDAGNGGVPRPCPARPRLPRPPASEFFFCRPDASAVHVRGAPDLSRRGPKT